MLNNFYWKNLNKTTKISFIINIALLIIEITSIKLIKIKLAIIINKQKYDYLINTNKYNKKINIKNYY